MKLMYSSIVLQVGIFYLLSVCLPSIEIIGSPTALFMNHQTQQNTDF